MENQHRRVVICMRRHDLQDRRRRGVAGVVNLGIALIDQQQEIMLAGQLIGFFEISHIGNGALRVGR